MLIFLLFLIAAAAFPFKHTYLLIHQDHVDTHTHTHERTPNVSYPGVTMIQHLRKYFLQNMLFYYDFFFSIHVAVISRTIKNIAISKRETNEHFILKD